MKTLTFALAFLFLASLSAQAPDFSLIDIDGVEHKLYDDYLNQGKTVMLHVGAYWNPFDSVFMETGVMQEFHSNYVSASDAVILFIDPNNPTIEMLSGGGNPGVGGLTYNFVEAINYPIISTDTSFTNLYEIAAFPTIRLICPDGTMYDDWANEELFYTKFETPEIVAETFFNFCGTNFDLANVAVDVYEDKDLDCNKGPNDSPLPQLKMNITGPNGIFTRFSREDGVVSYLAQEGDYDMELCPPNELWTACNSPQVVSITDTDQSESLEMGIQAVEDCSQFVAEITSPFLRRCFDSYVYVDYCNNGTVAAEDAFIEVTLDNFMAFKSSDPAPTSATGNVLYYDIGTVEVWECGDINIVVEISCDSELGDEQCYTATYGPVEACNTRSESSVTECQEIRGAFDPNDKRAFPLGDGDNYTILPDASLLYQIRFQNTGTDTAFNIVIEDFISDNLDLRSFTPGQSSHAYSTEINEDRKVTFKFDNIMLPDSNVNLLGSNGFVNYRIHQNPNHINGVKIENEAAIYFDFNEPIWTNKTVHTVDDGISKVNDIESKYYSIAPNPANDRLVITLKDEKYIGTKVQLLNLAGQQLRFKTLEKTTVIDVSDFDQGIYMVKLKDAQGTSNSLFSITR